jgi:protein-S-isoprenylcysteine O-methyltransferase Ste14
MNGGEDTPGIRIPPPVIFVGWLLAGFLAQRRDPVPLVAAGFLPEIRVLGAALVLCGFLLALSGIALFRLAGTSPNPMRPATALVRRGPYRVTRNPMYVGLASIHAGISLLFNALWPLAALLPALVLIRWLVIAREERYLRRKFGQEYEEYSRGVRRWF